LYTDGITEARSRDGAMFDDQRLTEALTSAPERPTAQHIIDALTQAVRTFTEGDTIDDDQAVLVLTATEPRTRHAAPSAQPHATTVT
ncbi:SpoIIE family protein phosphatase, partial [Streptomyces xiamenensis]